MNGNTELHIKIFSLPDEKLLAEGPSANVINELAPSNDWNWRGSKSPPEYKQQRREQLREELRKLESQHDQETGSFEFPSPIGFREKIRVVWERIEWPIQTVEVCVKVTVNIPLPSNRRLPAQFFKQAIGLPMEWMDSCEVVEAARITPDFAYRNQFSRISVLAPTKTTVPLS